MVGKSLVFDFFSEIEGKYKNKKKKPLPYICLQ